MNAPHRWRGLAWVIALMLAPHAAQAQDSLQELAARLRAVDPKVQAALATQRAQAERVAQAEAARRPSVTLNAQRGWQRGEFTFGDTDPQGRRIHSWSLALQASQGLIRPQLAPALREAQALARSASMDTEQTLDQATLDLFNTLCQWHIARASRQAEQAGVLQAEAQWKAAQRGHELGTHSRQAEQQAQARVWEARDRLASSRATERQRLAELRAQLAEPPQRLPALRDDLQLDAQAFRVGEHELDALLDQVPAVQARREAVAAALAAVQRAQAQHLPTLDVTAQHGPSYTSSNSGVPGDYQTFSRSTQIGLQFSLPLYSGGAVDSQVRESLARLQRSEADLAAARNEARLTVWRGVELVGQARESITTLEARLQVARGDVQAALTGERLGTASILDVLDARQRVASLNVDRIRARYTLVLEWLKVAALRRQGLDEALVALTPLFAGIEVTDPAKDAGPAALRAAVDVSPAPRP